MSIIRTVDDLSNDEVTMLVASLSAACPDDVPDADDALDETRVNTVLGRTTAIEDIKSFERDLLSKYVKIFWNESE